MNLKLRPTDDGRWLCYSDDGKEATGNTKAEAIAAVYALDKRKTKPSGTADAPDHDNPKQG